MRPRRWTLSETDREANQQADGSSRLAEAEAARWSSNKGNKASLSGRELKAGGATPRGCGWSSRTGLGRKAAKRVSWMSVALPWADAGCEQDETLRRCSSGEGPSADRPRKILRCVLSPSSGVARNTAMLPKTSLPCQQTAASRCTRGQEQLVAGAEFPEIFHLHHPRLNCSCRLQNSRLGPLPALLHTQSTGYPHHVSSTQLPPARPILITPWPASPRLFMLYMVRPTGSRQTSRFSDLHHCNGIRKALTRHTIIGQ